MISVAVFPDPRPTPNRVESTSFAPTVDRNEGIRNCEPNVVVTVKTEWNRGRIRDRFEVMAHLVGKHPSSRIDEVIHLRAELFGPETVLRETPPRQGVRLHEVRADEQVEFSSVLDEGHHRIDPLEVCSNPEEIESEIGGRGNVVDLRDAGDREHSDLGPIDRVLRRDDVFGIARRGGGVNLGRPDAETVADLDEIHPTGFELTGEPAGISGGELKVDYVVPVAQRRLENVQFA